MSQKKESHQSKEEKRPSKPGTYYGERSPEGGWWWKGTGSSEDQWITVPVTEEEHSPVPQVGRPEVTPLAASAAFYITINMVYPAGATQIGQATTYQVVTPWGQSTACICLDDAFNQVVSSGSQYSGQMGNYLNNGVTRGLVTAGGATVPQSASYFQALP